MTLEIRDGKLFMDAAEERAIDAVMKLQYDEGFRRGVGAAAAFVRSVGGSIADRMIASGGSVVAAKAIREKFRMLCEDLEELAPKPAN